MKVFSVEQDTVPVAQYQFPERSRQAQRALEENVERVFRWRDIRGNVNLLPEYVKKALHAEGYVPVYLGGTTYSHAVIGLAQGTSAT
jgi:hypothetical protein